MAGENSPELLFSSAVVLKESLQTNQTSIHPAVNQINYLLQKQRDRNPLASARLYGVIAGQFSRRNRIRLKGREGRWTRIGLL